jgi:hypothetical protein
MPNEVEEKLFADVLMIALLVNEHSSYLLVAKCIKVFFWA